MRSRSQAPLCRTVRIAPVVAAAATLSACGHPAGHDLFPLDAGTRWDYRVTTTLAGGDPESSELSLRALGREPMDDGTQAWHRRSEGGMDWWLRRDDTGIYRVASKSDNDPEPQPDEKRRYVLKAPYTVGTEWQATTAAYLLERPQSFPRELRTTHSAVPMRYAIEEVGASVQTPAGAFTGCLRVTGRAVLKLYLDPVTGWGDVPLTQTEWFCPGPGLVKLVRDEPGRSAYLQGGTYTMELIAWHPA